jgi:hypothetical protein
MITKLKQKTKYQNHQMYKVLYLRRIYQVRRNQLQIMRIKDYQVDHRSHLYQIINNLKNK